MMNKNNFKPIIDNKLSQFDSGETDFILLSKYKELVEDVTYFDFIIESDNGGYFYEQALHIYSYCRDYSFHNIEEVNSLLQYEYGDIIDGLISFGQDLFGNQFCFNTIEKNVTFFNVETGDRNVVASNFEDWINVINNELDYFTGINVLKTWYLDNNQLALNERLCPKIPFIIGGEFKVENLYAGEFPAFIKAYANIARQIHNLPDGTKIEIKIGKR